MRLFGKVFGRGKRSLQTPAHKEADRAVATSNPIHEAGYIPVGGIPQWVELRGNSITNPVILFLHGGPGESARVAAAGWREWETDFTIVHWDQRGAGRTFEKNGASGGAGMTIERMSADGLEVAQYVVDRLRVPKLILVGHSWGTVLGVRMIRVNPKLFSAYVGVAQVTSTRRNGALRFLKIAAQLRAQGDTKALRQLEQIGPPPYGSDGAKWAAFHELAMLIKADEFTPKLPSPVPSEVRSIDRRIIADGIAFSRQQIMSNGEFERVDLLTTDRNFEVPFFLFAGAQDHTTPFELSEEYVGLVDAPATELVRFEDAGHFFLFNSPERFFAELLKRVRPDVHYAR